MMSIKTQSFDELVDRWVYGAVTRGVTTFNSLVMSLPGVYPSVVLASLKRLAASGKFDGQNFEIMSGLSGLGEIESWQPPRPRRRIPLPVPHPLDYDWRFAESGVRYLLDACLTLTQPGETIALLGSPSVLRTAIEDSYPRRVVLLDSNAAAVDCFADTVPPGLAVRCDVTRDPLPQIEASAVIIDPPWYEEHMAAFMWAAAGLCRTGGHVLASIPPVGTRPGIDRDREALFDWARRLGLSLIRQEPAMLPYSSPPFEINALKAEGIRAILVEWRRGDLTVFRKDGREVPPQPAFPSTIEEVWAEGSLRGVRIRVKPHDSTKFKNPKLETIIDGDILPSASRRDERRSLADVWTSGNRVFACRGPHILRHVLCALVSGLSPEEAVARYLKRTLSDRERRLVCEAASQVIKLVERERSENLLLGESH